MGTQQISGGSYAALSNYVVPSNQPVLESGGVELNTAETGIAIPNVDIYVTVSVADTIAVGDLLRFSVAGVEFRQPTDGATLPADGVAALPIARPTTGGFGLAVALDASTTTDQIIRARIQGYVDVNSEGTITANGLLTIGKTAAHAETAAAGDAVYGWFLEGNDDALNRAVILPQAGFVV